MRTYIMKAAENCCEILCRLIHRTTRLFASKDDLATLAYYVTRTTTCKCTNTQQQCKQYRYSLKTQRTKLPREICYAGKKKARKKNKM